MARKLLIDGDIFVYKTATVCETPTDWGHDIWTLHAIPSEGIETIDATLNKLKDDFEADELVVCLSDAVVNFRKAVYPLYKSNRSDKRKPMLIPVLREHLVANYGAYIRPALEADDLLGILSTWSGCTGEKIIVTADKDLKGVPGLFVNIKEPDTIHEISLGEADRWHMVQTLTGDQCDGYGGCPGIGPVKAEKLLKDYTTYADMWPVVEAEFMKAGLGKKVALQMARLARILRAEDYNFKTKEPILWEPK